MITSDHFSASGRQHLTGQVAIVTGAGAGLGAAIAGRLGSHGATIVVNDVTTQALHEVADDIRRQGGEVIEAVADVTDEEQVRGMVELAASVSGCVDILVNNAGVLERTEFANISRSEWDRVVAVNLTGPFLMAASVVGYMCRQRRGKIVNIASMAGRATSTLGGAHYTASKAGLLGLTRHLARELAPFGINVNAVCPGIIDTSMVRGSLTPGEEEKIRSSIPFGRFANPDEIAALVEFLVSKDASYITGASVDIHGGEMIIQ